MSRYAEERQAWGHVVFHSSRAPFGLWLGITTWPLHSPVATELIHDGLVRDALAWLTIKHRLCMISVTFHLAYIESLFIFEILFIWTTKCNTMNVLWCSPYLSNTPPPTQWQPAFDSLLWVVNKCQIVSLEYFLAGTKIETINKFLVTEQRLEKSPKIKLCFWSWTMSICLSYDNAIFCNWKPLLGCNVEYYMK